MGMTQLREEMHILPAQLESLYLLLNTLTTGLLVMLRAVFFLLNAITIWHYPYGSMGTCLTIVEAFWSYLGTT